MKTAEFILEYRKIVLSLGFVLGVMGIISWLTMPREEDPAMKSRFGFIQAIHPGSPPEEMEKLVVQPLEKELARVSEIKKVETTIRSEFAIIVIELQDFVSTESQINEAWRNVENAMNAGRGDLPRGVIGPELDRNASDLDAIVYAVHGSDDPIALYDMARELEKELLRLDRVTGVGLPGDPGEEVRIEIDDRNMDRTGLGYDVLAGVLLSSNRALPGGSIRMDDRRVNVNTNSSFHSLEELRSFPIILASGKVIRLQNLAKVTLSPSDPPVEFFFYNGERSVGVAIVPRKGQDLVEFGKLIRKKVDRFKKSHEGFTDGKMHISEVSFQPDYVETRLHDLSINLLSSMITVAVVIFLGMGWKMGFLVSSLIPAIVVSSLGIFATGGGVLNQISIAAFVMSLGILIDNVIVIVEAIQDRMDQGEERFDAAKNTIADMAMPLATATGTTVAAFLPMLGSAGATADFTRAIPVIAILTLVLSYFFSVMITPSLSMMFLTPKTGRDGKESWVSIVGRKFGSVAYHRRWIVLLFISVYLVLAGAGFIVVRKKFFPSADRDQLTIKIQSPEGTHINTSREKAFILYNAIKDIPEIENVSMFVGRGVPRFYYNVHGSSRSPHISQFIVDLDSFESGEKVKLEIEKIARKVLPTTMVIVNEMEQGPPINAPIEILVMGENPKALQDAAEIIQKILQKINGTKNIRNNMGIGAPGLRFETGDANALQYGVDRNIVTSVLMARTRGIPLGQYRGGEEPVPVYLRSGSGEDMNVTDLENSYIRQTVSGSVYLKDLSGARPDWQPSLILHKNRVRYVSVLSQLKNGTDATTVMSEFNEKIKEIELPDGVRLETAGETGESGEANSAILAALPLGIGLFFISLLIEFRSFTKMGILIMALPLAMTGVVPGLLFTGNPFGFLSLLGMLALVGIAVNNGILILDATEKAREQGKTVEESVKYAVSQRLRPILLTTATTIFGLMPLALTRASLWPPFAWAIISGLAISALLSLLVIPAFYSIVYDEDSFVKKIRRSVRKDKKINNLFGVIVLMLPLLFMDQLRAEEMEKITFGEALSLAGSSPGVVSAEEAAKSAEAQAETYKRSVYFPKAGVGYNYNILSSRLQVGTPIGSVGGLSKSYGQGAIEIEQTIFDPGAMFYTVPAAGRMAGAAKLMSKRKREEAIAKVAERYLQVLEIQAKRESLKSLEGNLSARLTEIRRFYRFGRVSRVDLLRLQLAHSDAKSGLLTLEKKEEIAMHALGQSLGKDHPLKPAPIAEQDLPGEELLENLEEKSEAMIDERKDLQALEEELSARKMEKEELEWWFLPVFFIKGSYIHSDSGQFTRNNWMSLQAGVRLPLFEAGTRSTRRQSVEARIRELQATRQDAMLGIQVEIKNAMVDYSRNLEERKRLKNNLRDAQYAASLARQRYRSGKAMLQELMDAENLLFTTDEKLRLVTTDRIRSWIRLYLASGQLSKVIGETYPETSRPAGDENREETENNPG